MVPHVRRNPVSNANRAPVTSKLPASNRNSLHMTGPAQQGPENVSTLRDRGDVGALTIRIGFRAP